MAQALCFDLHVVLDFIRCKAYAPLPYLTLIDLPPHSLQLDLANSAIRTSRIAQCRQQFACQHYLLLIIGRVEHPAYPPYRRTNYVPCTHDNYQSVQIAQTLRFYFSNGSRVCCSVCSYGTRPHNHSAYKCSIFHSH